MASETRTAPERIREWAERQCHPRYVDGVTDRLVDAATGNPINPTRFEREALERIFPEWRKGGDDGC